jgi:uncharacterized protein (DUF3820 family)
VGNRSLKHPVYSKHTIFDVRGKGGQVVAAGSIHPDTGKQYTLEKEVKGVPVPNWLLAYIEGGEIDTDVLWGVPMPDNQEAGFVESLKVSDRIKQLILDGVPTGERSENGAAVITALLGAGYLRYYLKLNINATAHTAIGDVLVLEGIFQRIYAKFKGQTVGEDPVAEMVKISGSPVLVPRMPFGKHKGLKMAEVPKDYLEWLSGTDLDEDLGYTVGHYLGRLSTGPDYDVNI